MRRTYTALLLLAFAATAAATEAEVEVLAASCSGCHGSTAAVPAGDRIRMPDPRALTAADLAGRLRAYRDGTLAGTVMNRIAKGYSSSEIEQLAQFLGLKAP